MRYTHQSSSSWEVWVSILLSPWIFRPGRWGICIVLLCVLELVASLWWVSFFAKVQRCAEGVSYCKNWLLGCKNHHVVIVHLPICEINGKVNGLMGPEYQGFPLLWDFILATLHGKAVSAPSSQEEQKSTRKDHWNRQLNFSLWCSKYLK